MLVKLTPGINLNELKLTKSGVQRKGVKAAFNQIQIGFEIGCRHEEEKGD